MKKITLLLIAISALKFSFSQTYQWTKTIGGTHTESPSCMITDVFGNIYLCGSFSHTVDFDPGIGNYSLSSNAYYTSLFIEKFNADGNFLWVKTFDQSFSNGYMAINGITADTLGNIYFCGYFSGNIDVDPGLGTTYLSSAIGNASIYMEKLDSNGNYSWAKSIENLNGLINGTSINISENGDLYVSGYFSDTVVFDSGSNVDLHISNGYADIFVMNMTGDGDFVWARTFGGINGDFGYCVTSDQNDNVYITGSFMILLILIR